MLRLRSSGESWQVGQVQLSIYLLTPNISLSSCHDEEIPPSGDKGWLSVHCTAPFLLTANLLNFWKLTVQICLTAETLKTNDEHRAPCYESKCAIDPLECVRHSLTSTFSFLLRLLHLVNDRKKNHCEKLLTINLLERVAARGVWARNKRVDQDSPPVHMYDEVDVLKKEQKWHFATADPRDANCWLIC